MSSCRKNLPSSVSTTAIITQGVTNRARYSQLTTEKYEKGSTDVFDNALPAIAPMTIAKWKWNSKAPEFPTPEKAAVLAPSTKIDLDRLRKYFCVDETTATTKNGNEGANNSSESATATAFLPTDRNKLLVTWMGHASFFVQVDGANILTDPVFSERCSPVSFAGPKRYVPVPCKVEDLPRVDIVTISHNHYDHLDNDTVDKLRKVFNPVFVVPRGMKSRYFATLGWPASEVENRVVELGWYQSTEIQIAPKRQEGASMSQQVSTSSASSLLSPQGSRDAFPKSEEDVVIDANKARLKSVEGEFTSLVQITFTPVQHWTARGAFDRNKELWGAFVVEHYRSLDPAGHRRVFNIRGRNDVMMVARWFHNGDTGYNPKYFKEIGQEFAADDILIEEMSNKNKNDKNNSNTTSTEATPQNKKNKDDDDEDDESAKNNNNNKNNVHGDDNKNEKETSTVDAAPVVVLKKPIEPLFDLALIPIGAYEPRYIMQKQHIDPEEAVVIHQELLGPKLSLGMHWGTFILTDEPLDEPPRKLAEACKKLGVAEGSFVAVKHGETREVCLRGF